MKIFNGTILTGDGQVYPNGCVSFQDGRITALGPMRAGEEVSGEDYDAGGGYILPGLVDPHCHVGSGPEAVGSTEYSELYDPLVPHYDAADAFLPVDPAIRKALRRGITTVVGGPGSTALAGGQLAAFKLNGAYAPQACIKRACAVKFALGEAPKSAFGGRGRAPGTRMAAAALLRRILDETRACLDTGKTPSAACKAMLPLLEGKIPAHIHAQRADDIRFALSLAEEYHFRVVIVHGQQSPQLIEEMRRVGAGVIFGPLFFTSRDMESDGISFRSPEITRKAGILTAVCTDACPGLSSVQLLPTTASLLAREGMDPMDALRCVSLDAARLCGIENRVGSLAVGKDADIAVYDRFPLELTARVRVVFVDGRRAAL